MTERAHAEGHADKDAGEHADGHAGVWSGSWVAERLGVGLTGDEALTDRKSVV